jgi:DNA-binding LacI/PurR family transcriptional regulator
MANNNFSDKVITIKDIATVVGVSTSTVSRVLNGTKMDLISEKTREKVLRAAGELGYSSNPLARALKGKQTYLLGLIVREISDPFFTSIISHLSTQAESLGYHIVLAHAHSDTQEAIQMSVALDTRHLDGMFVLGDLHDDETALRRILQKNRVVVAMCHGPNPEWIPKVNIDNQLGVTMMLDYLYSLGHRRLAFIDGGWLGDIRERLVVFKEYVKLHSIDQSAQIITAPNNDATGGYEALKEILGLTPRPTAVFAADDVMAFGALKAAADSGISVPKDLSIVGFDDVEFTQYTSPSLTTIRQPIEEMSRHALSLIIDLIEKKNITPELNSTLISPELIIRQSSGPVP